MANRLKIPVVVLLERRLLQRGRWKFPSWQLSGVLAGDALVHNLESSEDGQKVRDTEHGEEFSWGGYSVTLYKDACERYWHSLISDEPKVYVVCDEDEADSAVVTPLLVTIDYDEAIAYVETDQLVLSSEITPELYRYMEAFVLQHYRPKPFEKRKRKKWTTEPPAHRRGLA
ncbi:MAG: DUF3305 domain-containing protein [Gammaproteobacteria bacterium]|nr:DUF3305 domain-containing protein [Gammaproteobacteria bacterium]